MLQFTRTMAAICTGSLCIFTCHQLPVLGSALTKRTMPLARAVVQGFSLTQTAEEQIAIPAKQEPVSTISPEELLAEVPPVPVATAATTVSEPPVATPIPTTSATVTTTVASTATETSCTASTAETTETVSATEPPEEPEPETEPVSVEQLDSEEQPEILTAQETWFKAYMDYRTITDTDSAQYALQQEAWTDAQGLRRVGEDYLVAMGTGWLEEGCGERFQVTLETGSQFTVMVGDVKADCHTDAAHFYRPCSAGANVLEFIVDTSLLSQEARTAGTISVYPEFAGNIVEIRCV